MSSRKKHEPEQQVRFKQQNECMVEERLVSKAITLMMMMTVLEVKRSRDSTEKIHRTHEPWGQERETDGRRGWRGNKKSRWRQQKRQPKKNNMCSLEGVLSLHSLSWSSLLFHFRLSVCFLFLVCYLGINYNSNFNCQRLLLEPSRRDGPSLQKDTGIIAWLTI